jgi:hypothetical protein
MCRYCIWPVVSQSGECLELPRCHRKDKWSSYESPNRISLAQRARWVKGLKTHYAPGSRITKLLQRGYKGHSLPHIPVPTHGCRQKQSCQPIRIPPGNAPKFCQNTVNPDVTPKRPVSAIVTESTGASRTGTSASARISKGQGRQGLRKKAGSSLDQKRVFWVVARKTFKNEKN